MKELDKRVDKDIQITEDLYSEGLLDITQFLCSELEIFLGEEGRYMGITKSYVHSIHESFSKMNKKVSESDIEVYGKILYLFKPLLKREFRRLKSKKLSSGDSIIVMINKILEIIFTEKTQQFKYNKELRTIRKIINKFYENIRNPKKKDPLYILSNTIKLYKESGKIGKFPLDQFSLIDSNSDEKIELESPGERVKVIDKKVSEVSL